jgi:hypothetical protein
MQAVSYQNSAWIYCTILTTISAYFNLFRLTSLIILGFVYQSLCFWLFFGTLMSIFIFSDALSSLSLVLSSIRNIFFSCYIKRIFLKECQSFELTTVLDGRLVEGVWLLHVNHLRHWSYTFSNQKVVAIPEVTSPRKKLLTKQDVMPQVDGYTCFQSPGVWQCLGNPRVICLSSACFPKRPYHYVVPHNTYVAT